YSSVLRSLLVGGVAEALQATRARRVLVANIMTEPGETGGMAAVDHVRAVLEHAGPVVDVALLNSAPLGLSRVDRYAREGAEPVRTDLERIRALGVVPVEADLLRAGPRLRHDPRKLGQALLSVACGQGGGQLLTGADGRPRRRAGRRGPGCTGPRGDVEGPAVRSRGTDARMEAAPCRGPPLDRAPVLGGRGHLDASRPERALSRNA